MVGPFISRFGRVLPVLIGMLVGAASARPPAMAQEVAPPAVGALTSPDNLTVVLLTFGAGDQVWEKFGHNAIWIHDPVAGTDEVYNWGVFDFNSPGYWRRFVKGTWIYQIAAEDIQRTMAIYRYLNRTVTAQELELTPAESREVQAYIEWNMRPENREYLYDYYLDNCSTRVRDLLDRVLGGALRAATASVPTGTTFRWHTRRLVAGDPVIYTALEAGLGPAADRPISQWEEMFLPEKVKERVREMRVADANGARVPLVRSERVLYSAVGRPAERAAPPGWIPRFLIVGLGIALVFAALGHAASRNGLGRLAFSVVAVVWALFVGGGGLLLIGIWAFTNHHVAYANENILQFTPLALPLVVLLPALAYRAGWAVRWGRRFAVAAAACAVLGFILQALPALDQVNGEIIALMLPANVALAGVAWGLARARDS